MQVVTQGCVESGTENLILVIQVLWVKLHQNSSKSVGTILFNLITLVGQLTYEKYTPEGQLIKPRKEATIILHVGA